MEKKKIQYPYEYDPKRRQQSKVYSKVKIIAGLINGLAVPIVFLILFYFSGASLMIRSLLPAAVAVPLYIVILLTLLVIVQFPLRFYSAYVYERKYGLSAYTLRGWFTDFFKELLLSYLFSVIILSILYSFMGIEYWWIYGWLLYIIVEIFMNNIYPLVILPFFYKVAPFKDAELEKRFLSMVKKAGGKGIEKIVVAKESEKSTKANALFAGMGKSKRMVLFDTLLDNFTTDEVETVIGHELGHYVNKDVWRDLAFTAIFLFIEFYIVNLVLLYAIQNWGLPAINDSAGLPLLMVTFSIFDLIIMPLHNAYSRRREAAADWFSLEAIGKPQPAISTEKRLADMALSDHLPHPFVEFMLYSHPCAEKRVAMVKEWETGKK